MLGLRRAFSTSASGSGSMAETQPRMTPWSRRWRVSALVSMPLMPGAPAFSSHSLRFPVARQLLGRSHTSRHTIACARTEALSKSSAFTP